MKDIEQLQFSTREEFRKWLCENCQQKDSIWLIFGKKGGPRTLSTNEALEEALCFGWIDGLIKSLDENKYLKHFSPRRKGSNWSEKNKNTVDALEKQGRMTDHGRAKVEEAKANGKWDAVPIEMNWDEIISTLTEALKDREPAYSNFMAMSSSVRATYSAFYNAPKSDATKAKRLAVIIDRLNKNLKPM